MRTIRVTLLLLTVTAGLAAAAEKPAPLPTAENMAHAWAAVGPSGTHYRLVLDGLGQGHLGVKPRFQPAVVYKVETTEIDRYKVRLHMMIGGSTVEPLTAQGDGTPRSFTLRSSRVFGKDSITFFPDSEWQDAERTLQGLLPESQPR